MEHITRMLKKVFILSPVLTLIISIPLYALVIFVLTAKIDGILAYLSFYAVITAIVNIVKYRRYGSPVMLAAKSVNLVAAMVSILSLETAMLARFGEDDERFRFIMTGATGGCVCTIVIGMAVFMIVKATRKLKSMN